MTVGGDVEAMDSSIAHREELEGKLGKVELVHRITDVFEDGVGVTPATRNP